MPTPRTEPTAGRRRSTRGRPSKAPLSEDAVVESGLELLQREGIDAVTMRRVAAMLDTGAASLYVYVKNRGELLDLMFDRIAGSVPLPEVDAATWRPAIRQLCRDMRAALEAHPGIAAVSIAKIPLGRGALLAADRMMALLLAGGAEPKDAAWASDNLWLLVTATAVETEVEQRRGHAPSSAPGFTYDDLRRHFAELPADEFPALAAHHEVMTSGDEDQRFLFAIDTYLDGLVARTAQRRG